MARVSSKDNHCHERNTPFAALRDVPPAVNLIHHPDEPDGVRTRDAATIPSMTGDCQGDRLSKCLDVRPGYPFTGRSNSPEVPAESNKN